MRGEAPWVCDNCGKRRGEDVNHWFVIQATDYVSRDRKNIVMHTPIPLGLLIHGWDDSIATLPDAKHACGANCRNILVERFFSTGSFEIHKLNEEVGS